MFPSLVDKFTLEAPFLNPELVMDLKMGIKRSTGEKFAKVKTLDGKIFIKTVSPSGIVSTTFIEIPPYNSKEKRDHLIQELRESGMVQDDIADYLGIAQSTVSNVLKKSRY